MPFGIKIMATKKVKVLTSFCSETGSFQVGEVRECDATLVPSWVQFGLVEEVATTDKPKK